MPLLAAFRTAAISAPHRTGSSSPVVTGALSPCEPQAVTAPLTISDALREEGLGKLERALVAAAG